MSRDGIELSLKHEELCESSPAERSRRSPYGRGKSALKRLRKPDMPAKSSYSLENADDSQRTKRQINDGQTFSMSEFA